MKLECPFCYAALTSMTEASRTSPMWGSLIRQAKKDDEPAVGVCYGCGELIDAGSFSGDDWEKAWNHVFSSASRSMGQQFRREAERQMKETRTPIWVGQTFETWCNVRDTQYAQAKLDAIRRHAENR